jgi:hypothetical protein
VLGSSTTTESQTAKMRTSTRPERGREPRTLRSGTGMAGEKDLGAAPPTVRHKPHPVGGDGRDLRYKVTASRERSRRAGKGRRRGSTAAKWGGTTGKTPLVPNRGGGFFVTVVAERGVTFRVAGNGPRAFCQRRVTWTRSRSSSETHLLRFPAFAPSARRPGHPTGGAQSPHPSFRRSLRAWIERQSPRRRRTCPRSRPPRPPRVSPAPSPP